MAIDDDIAFFERVPTLGLLGRQALRILAIGAETRQVDRGEVLFSAGEQDPSGPATRPGPHADQGKGPPMHRMASAAHVRDRGNSNPACSFTPECSIPPNAPCRDAAAPGADE